VTDLWTAALAVLAWWDSDSERGDGPLFEALRAALAPDPRPHEWMTDDKHDYEWCRRCLYVRQANGSSDAKPCKGPAKVTLRAATPAPLDVRVAAQNVVDRAHINMERKDKGFDPLPTRVSELEDALAVTPAPLDPLRVAALAVLDARPMDWSVPPLHPDHIEVHENAFDALMDAIDVLERALEATRGYDRPLSDLEVRAHYSPVSALNPVAYWRLDEKTTGPAVDLTGSNPGTYTTSTWPAYHPEDDPAGHGPKEES
jgi:hypothetical protein